MAGADFRALAGQVAGRVFLPGSAGFRVGSKLFNTRYGDRTPAAVVTAAHTEDVQRALTWAREQGVPVVARNGGHSFAGYSVNEGLVIDLSRLTGTTADGSTGLVTAGGGAKISHVYDAMQPHEMVFSTGTSPTVGVAGLALGGGAAFAARRYGLTADALVETSVVLADGSLVVASERENPDLFWACKGGGGGNFGINVSLTFQARPVPDVTTFHLTWKWADAAAVLDAGQRMVELAPDDFAARLGVWTYGTGLRAIRDNLEVTLQGQYFGSARDCLEILDPVLSAAAPVSRDVTERTFWEANKYMVHATSGDQFALRSNYIREPLAAEGVQTLLSWVERWPGSHNGDGGGAGLFSWGGAINRIAPDATAFVHRDTLFLVSMDTAWTEDDSPAQVDANLDWLNGLHAAMAPHVTGSAYQNFVDPELTDWRTAYYGANYARLTQVKEKYDPDGVFSFDQAIGT
ncbi:FAD-binding oxidoreductase [Streptomyces sp. NPDC090119]|uniref:FAD-binding oxidoreductase n=1 Tax=Streptomyces sp. NPDC090119 TaxID=3365951 RepID=UPI0037F7CE24